MSAEKSDEKKQAKESTKKVELEASEKLEEKAEDKAKADSTAKKKQTEEKTKTAEKSDTTTEEKTKTAEKSDTTTEEKTKTAEKSDTKSEEQTKTAEAGKDEGKTTDSESEKDNGKTSGSETGGEKKFKSRGDRAQDIFKQLGIDDDEPAKVVRAKKSKNVRKGIIHISATFNNTIVTISDEKGDVIGWSSGGKVGMKGSRKSTAYAAQLVAQDACRQAMSHGFREAKIRVKGPGSGREPAVRASQNIGIEITEIKDITPIPHNGCRPPKARRV